jgi:hypothetical protein
MGSQTTYSEGHSWPQRGKGLTDIGGSFYTQKSYAVLPSREVSIDYIDPGGLWVRQIGTPVPAINLGAMDTLFPSRIDSSEEELKILGTKAVSRALPTNPLAQGSTAAGELMKDGLPDLPLVHSLERRAKIAYGAGSEFLNAAFGWLPLKNDIHDLANGVINMDEHIRKYEQQSGKPHRASVDLPTESSSEVVYTSYPTSCTLSGGVMDGTYYDTGQRGNFVVRYNKTKRRWFKGSFTYYLPSGYDSRNKISKYADHSRHLLGIELTPEVLWNLAPWSWAIDWFSNTGDVLNNVSRFADNGLVMHYGYLMEHTIHELVITHEGPSGILGVGGVEPLRFITETKSRTPASPYGFGVNLDALSSFQTSVLVALGLTHRR